MKTTTGMSHRSRLVADLLQHLEARHVGQPQVEHHAVDGLLAQRLSASLAGAGRDDLDVVVAEQLGDAELLGGLSSTTSRRLRRGCAKSLIRRQRRLQALGRRRLGDEREGAARQAVLPVLVQRDDLHRDVPRRRVLLELAEHGPAQHVGQEDVERHGGRPVLARQRQRLGAARRDQHLEAVVAREVDQDAGVMRIVLDDQQDVVARLDDVAGRRTIGSIGRSAGAESARSRRRADASAGAAPDVAGRAAAGAPT